MKKQLIDNAIAGTVGKDHNDQLIVKKAASSLNLDKIKNVKHDIVTQLTEHITEFMTEQKDVNTAISMANKTGVLINDVQLSKLLEFSIKAKERFKQIIEISSFDPPAIITAEPLSSTVSMLKGVKEANLVIDKKISAMRITRTQIKSALYKKYRRVITEKILSIWESQTPSTQFLPIGGYMQMIQDNFLASCTAQKNWVVPRLYKFYFQLLMSGDKFNLCEHDIFVFIQELEGVAPLEKKPGATSAL